MEVKEIMNKVFVIESDVSIKEAARIMSDKNIGSLVVTKKGKLQGIVTEHDVMKNISNLGRKVSQVMTKDVKTIEPNESIDNAALIMSGSKVRRLPVVDKGVLVGIITATDLIANSDILNEEFFFD